MPITNHSRYCNFSRRSEHSAEFINSPSGDSSGCSGRHGGGVTRYLISVLFVSCLVTGCDQTKKSDNLLDHVDVTEVHAKKIPYVLNYPAMVQGVVDYQVIPRVNGELFKQYYIEGTYVKKDQPLYLVDPRPYEWELKAYQGQLIKDEAALKNYRLIYERYVSLYSYKAVSTQDVENARIQYKAALGNVKTDKANIAQTKLNLRYCLVRSPADGYIGERLVTVGTMVTAFKTMLNDINSVNQMYLLFSMPESQRLDIEDGVINKTVEVPKNNTFRVDIELSNGKIIKDSAYVEFTDTRIALSNGSWNMRAYVDNRSLKNKLLSGQYLTVYINGVVYLNMFGLPQEAVMHDDSGSFVYVVNNKHAEKRYIKTGKMYNEIYWMIPQGLKENDTVVVKGNTRIASGQEVVIDSVIRI